MGYVPMHMYLVTGDERYRADYERQQRRAVIGLIIMGILSLAPVVVFVVWAIKKFGFG